MRNQTPEGGEYMTNAVQTKNTVCSLDYLVGTLSTAYKGSLRSLVVKDFCMTDGGAETSLQGTVLALPDGRYEASLNQSGIELARVDLAGNGAFSFTADRTQIAASRDLQIDIVQSGRHIGTFLLKKESAGGLYVSAVELSRELAGVDLALITTPLRDKVGLLRKAEEIVSQVHSTKKNWPVFSEEAAGFARDFFWSERAAFFRAFPVLVRFLILAAERTDPLDRNKPVANYFDLLDLLFEQEGDTSGLRPLAELWVDALTRSSIDPAPHGRRTFRVPQKDPLDLSGHRCGGSSAAPHQCPR